MKDPCLQPLLTRGFGNKCGRLFQGIRDIPGTNTCFFIKLTNIPKDRNITYGKIVCDYKPHKKEKIMSQVNSRRRQARLLQRRRDVHGGHHNIQNPDQQHPFHQGRSHDDDGHKKMLYGHSFAAVWLHENVVVTISRRNSPKVQPQHLSRWRLGVHWNQERHLAPFGYYPARHTPGLWLHKTRPISFSLVVDDFTVKYVGKQHTDHLRNALLKTYELKTDWTGTVYSGMTLKWDYKHRTCDISMPGYVSNVLRKFQHDAPKHPQHTPSRYVTPVYGVKTQYATKYDIPPLTAKQCLTIQKVTGSVLYYARAVDPTVLMPLNDISTEQTKATEKTQAATNQLLDYWATHPAATIRYHASNIILHIHSDASYLSVSHSRSRLRGLFF
jgi:hypothetical protein